MRSDLRAVVGRGLVFLNLAAAVAAAVTVVLAWVSPATLGDWNDERQTLTLHLGARHGVRLVSWLGLLLLIADVLFLSTRTVETYRAQIMDKLNIRTVAGLTKYAIRHGLSVMD